MKKEELLKKFGSRIREKRLAMNLSQLKLAELADCSLQAMGNIECGKANSSIFMVYRIARALKLHPRDILP